MGNGKERAERFMNAASARKNKPQKGVTVHMRIHEDDAAGFIDGLIKYAEQVKIQSN